MQPVEEDVRWIEAIPGRRSMRYNPLPEVGAANEGEWDIPRRLIILGMGERIQPQRGLASAYRSWPAGGLFFYDGGVEEGKVGNVPGIGGIGFDRQG